VHGRRRNRRFGLNKRLVSLAARAALLALLLLDTTLVCQGHQTPTHHTGLHLVWMDHREELGLAVEDMSISAGVEQQQSQAHLTQTRDPQFPTPDVYFLSITGSDPSEGAPLESVGFAPPAEALAAHLNGAAAAIAHTGTMRSQTSLRPDFPPPRSNRGLPA